LPHQPMAGGAGFTDGDWNCTKCGDLQFRRNIQCRKCGNPKPGMEATAMSMRLQGVATTDYLNPGKAANPQGTAAMQQAMAAHQAKMAQAPQEKGFRKFSDGPADSRVAPPGSSLFRPSAGVGLGMLDGLGDEQAKKEEEPSTPAMRTIRVGNVQSKESIENDLLKVMNFKFGTIADVTVNDGDGEGPFEVLVEFESLEACQKALSKQVMKFNGNTWPISSLSGETVKPSGFSTKEEPAPKAPRLLTDGSADDAVTFALHTRGGEHAAAAAASSTAAPEARSRSRSRRRRDDKDRDRRRRRDEDEDSDDRKEKKKKEKKKDKKKEKAKEASEEEVEEN